MSAILRGGPEVEVDVLASGALRESVDALITELQDWAFQREKVLEKLDLRAARRARKAATALRALVRTAHESGDIDEAATGAALEEAHAILCAPPTKRDSMAPESAPPVSGVVSQDLAPRAPKAPLAPMYGEEEPTRPGHRGARPSPAPTTATEAATVPTMKPAPPFSTDIASLVAHDDEDDEDHDKTRAGVPVEVVAEYLREVRKAV